MNAIFERLLESEENKNLIETFLSTRSVLYNLEPVGIGTPYLESLSSYISRLAIKHNVKVSSFFKEMIAPLLKTGYLKNKLLNGSVPSKYYLINGIGTFSEEFITALERLTGRNDIQYMAMASWSGIYSKNITVHHKRWCPVCLNQFRQKSNEVYAPLIWYITDINKCDIHEISLQEHCCNRQVVLNTFC